MRLKYGRMATHTPSTDPSRVSHWLLPNRARPFHERRRHRRLEMPLRVELRDTGERVIAHNIGPGGLMITTHHARWPGELLRVRFRLPVSHRAICATCRVVNLVEVPRGVGLAMTFVGLDARAHQALERFVSDDVAASSIAAEILEAPLHEELSR